MRRYVLPLAAGAVVALSACSPADFTDRDEHRYATYAEFVEETGDDYSDVTWLPQDATRLASVQRDNGEGRMLSFTSPTGVDPAVCPAGPLTGEPYFEANWWPSGEPTDGLVCGDWQIFAAGPVWYGWTP